MEYPQVVTLQNLYKEYRLEFQRSRKLCDLGSKILLLEPTLSEVDKAKILKAYERGEEKDLMLLRIYIKNRIKGE